MRRLLDWIKRLARSYWYLGRRNDKRSEDDKFMDDQW